ncbi:hypothetical protein [Nitrosopumilus sp.]
MISRIDTQSLKVVISFSLGSGVSWLSLNLHATTLTSRPIIIVVAVMIE